MLVFEMVKRAMVVRGRSLLQDDALNTEFLKQGGLDDLWNAAKVEAERQGCVSLRSAEKKPFEPDADHAAAGSRQ